MTRLATLGSVLLLTGLQSAIPCTLISTAAGEGRLVANNLDCGNVCLPNADRAVEHL